MKITVETVSHDSQRYDTVGDWEFDDAGDLRVKVSAMGDWRKEACVALHEVFEALACLHAGVPEPDVVAFDVEYERNRPEGDYSEPGDSPLAPYGVQHRAATHAELLLAFELGLDWREYNDAVMGLDWRKGGGDA